jgi:hypothetical protein
MQVKLKIGFISKKHWRLEFSYNNQLRDLDKYRLQNLCYLKNLVDIAALIKAVIESKDYIIEVLCW